MTPAPVPPDAENPEPQRDELVTGYITGDQESLRFVDAMTAEEFAKFERRIDEAFADPPSPAGRAAASPDPPNEEACLRWTCESCGWNVVVPMPGYAGDGHYHYERGNTPCGPLVARREGFIRARPGATLYFPAATSHGSDEGSTNPGDGPDHEPSPGAASPDERLREALAIIGKIPQEQLARIMESVPASSAVSASLVDRSFKTTAVDDQLVAKAAWLPRIEPPAREAVTFRRLEQLEGVVLSIDVDEGTFRARLVDPRGEQPDQEADIELEQVAYGDQSLLRPGALFFWTVGYRTRGRRRELALAIEFRRFPKVSRSTLEGEIDRAVAAYLESAGWTE